MSKRASRGKTQRQSLKRQALLFCERARKRIQSWLQTPASYQIQYNSDTGNTSRDGGFVLGALVLFLFFCFLFVVTDDAEQEAYKISQS